MNNQLQDLILPSKQVEPNYLIWLGLFMLLVVFGWALWRWRKYRKQTVYIAYKKLQKLLNQSCESNKDSKELALQIASILRQGLGVTRLDQFDAGKNRPKWERFRKRLNEACYSFSSFSTSSSASTFSKEEINLNDLINNAMQWLRDQDK